MTHAITAKAPANQRAAPIKGGNKQEVTLLAASEDFVGLETTIDSVRHYSLTWLELKFLAIEVDIKLISLKRDQI